MTIDDFLREKKQIIPREFWSDLAVLTCERLEHERRKRDNPVIIDRTYLIVHGNDELFLDNQKWIEKQILARVVDKKPLAQIIGRKEFYGRDFKVTENVLIPRPETETIIDCVKEIIKNDEFYSKDGTCTVLDIGTGSGCIAITLALELPGVIVEAIDNSNRALEVAQENAKRLGANVFFRLADFRNERSLHADIIVANLPYVNKNWEWLDKKALSHEPAEALYAARGGLGLIESLILQAGKQCKYLVLEADPCQHRIIVKYAKEHGFEHVKTDGFVLVLGN